MYGQLIQQAYLPYKERQWSLHVAYYIYEQKCGVRLH